MKITPKIAIQNNLNIFITFDKKRKIKWECTFEKIKNVPKVINKNDIFFCFERNPHKYIKEIKPTKIITTIFPFRTFFIVLESILL